MKRNDYRERAELLALTPAGDAQKKLIGILEQQVALMDEDLDKAVHCFEELVEAFHEGILIHDNGTVVMLNEALATIVGSSKQSLVGRSIYDFLQPDIIPSVKVSAEKRLSHTYRTQLIRDDGGIVDVEIQSRNFEYFGRMARIASIRDLTEDRKTSLALEESQNQFSLFMDFFPGCGFIKDAASRLIYCNHYMLETVASPSWLGKSPGDYLPSDQAAEVFRQDAITLENGQIEIVENMPDKTGELRTFRSFRFRMDRQGKPPLIGGMSVDITEKKKLGEELIKQQKLESIGILAGGIAHDFNNILMAISGYLALLNMDDELPAHSRAYAAKAARGIFRAKALSTQLLTFAKGGAPVLEVTSIAELVKDSADFVLRGTNVVCDYDLPDNLWDANVDKVQISQVIQNLVINAVQAMPHGGNIHVMAANLDTPCDDPYLERLKTSPEHLPCQHDDTKFVKISVSDNGCGIPPEKIKKIFDPFFTTKATGNGLGLSIVYSIVNRHEGAINVTSVPDQGTRFDVYIPSTGGKTDFTRQAEEKPVMGSGRILVMEDDEDIRNVTISLMNQLGYQAECVSNGEEVLRVYQEKLSRGEPFDAVILDLTIRGGMGGRETMELLLGMDSEARGIVSSGFANDPVVADFRRHGFSAALSKPYDVVRLSRTLHTVTARHRRR